MVRETHTVVEARESHLEHLFEQVKHLACSVLPQEEMMLVFHHSNQYGLTLEVDLDWVEADQVREAVWVEAGAIFLDCLRNCWRSCCFHLS